MSGQLWDFWGAGPIGVALGDEYRKETTEAIGRTARLRRPLRCSLNGGPDFPERPYDTNEVFAEVSLPLFRDSFLGDYAELSGSYRYSDYSTVGKQDVYGVNLVYRPIPDIAFKTSFNTSIRVPSLGENFSPASQTFAHGFVDPCATAQINAAGLAADIRANRIANCTTLAQAQGSDLRLRGHHGRHVDDFAPVYTSSVAGVNSAQPVPEAGRVGILHLLDRLQPRFIPNLSLVLDYYEIEIDNVIAAVGGPDRGQQLRQRPDAERQRLRHHLPSTTRTRRSSEPSTSALRPAIRSAASSRARSTTPSAPPAVWTSRPTTASIRKKCSATTGARSATRSPVRG